MILAIDESGDFRPESDKYNFFVCAHIRQDRDLYDLKKQQFENWENQIDPSYKNHKGEIKSSLLPNEILYDFLIKVIVEEPMINISPVCIRTILNPIEVVEKHKNIHLAGINNGVFEYHNLGRHNQAKMYSQFANWYRKIDYVQFVKIMLLGNCMYKALRDSIGHSISDGYEHELVNLKYKIDKIFLRGLEQNAFWHELMRNQLYALSEENPIPCLIEWKVENHPFYLKYHSGENYNFNKLFWGNTNFVQSHEHFEIRIADTISTILNRHWNLGQCKELYKIIKYCFTGDGKIKCIVLNDFDFDQGIGQIRTNPWA